MEEEGSKPIQILESKMSESSDENSEEREVNTEVNTEEREDNSEEQFRDSGSFNIYENQNQPKSQMMAEPEDDSDEDKISFDENEDFPEYANEKNKELNEKVRETKKHIALIDKSISENRERYRLLEEHYRNIKEVSTLYISQCLTTVAEIAIYCGNSRLTERK